MVDLRKGWNAVYLEVEPASSSPEAVFGSIPVDIVATYFASKTSVQFVTDPGTDLFRNLGWAVWYAADRPDAFLTTLDAVYGRRAYLVHAQRDHRWNVKGTVLPEETIWRPDSFNFVGFQVASPGAPSFAQFFGGSKAHRHNKIYRLADGAWRRVTRPDAEPMKSGEAFWIFCEGASAYQGPLDVQTRLRKGLLLVDGATDDLIVRNDSDFPITATVEHVTPLSESVPLSVKVRVVGDPAAPVRSGAAPKPSGKWTQTLPVLEGRRALRIPFETRRAEMGQAVHASLLKITTDLGTESWVPVIGYRSDLAAGR